MRPLTISVLALGLLLGVGVVVLNLPLTLIFPPQFGPGDPVLPIFK